MDGLFRPWCKLQGIHLNSQKWKWHVRTSKCAIQSILFTFEQLLKAQRSRETKRTRLAKANSWWCLRMITPFGTYRSARLSFWNITAYLDWHMILFMFPFPCFLLQGFTFDWRVCSEVLVVSCAARAEFAEHPAWDLRSSGQLIGNHQKTKHHESRPCYTSNLHAFGIAMKTIQKGLLCQLFPCFVNAQDFLETNIFSLGLVQRIMLWTLPLHWGD